MRKITIQQPDKAFHNAVKARVDAYFEETGLSRHANAAMVRKTIFWIGLLAVLHGFLLTGIAPPVVAVGIFLVLGFVIACIGFNVGHDAIHGAYSDKPWVNRILSVTFDLLGANSRNWSVAHNYIHHTYTNVPGVDTDLEPGPYMRFGPHAPYRWFHRFQHIYGWSLYTLTTLVWLFVKDWMQILVPDPRTGRRASRVAVLGLFAGKAGHFAIFLVAPLLFSGYSPWLVIPSYVASHMVCGFTLAVVFQLAHVVESTSYPAADAEGVLRTDWAAHQLRTTANFSNGRWLATAIVGGLNHQVEHHLFPRVCHVHYKALAPIVRDTALEYGVPYNDSGSFFEALASHYRTMRALANRETTIGMDATPMPMAKAA